MRRYALALMLLAPLAPGGCDCDVDPLARQYPRMNVSPKDVTLDNVPIAQDTEIVFTVSNPALVDLHELHVELSEGADPAFTLDEDYPVEVLGGTSAQVRLTVRPLAKTTIEATLVFTAQDDAVPPRVEVPIKVTGIDAGVPDIEATPAVVEFGAVGRLDVARASVDVKNVGTRDLLLDCVYFVPTGADDSDASIDDCPVQGAFDDVDASIGITTPVGRGSPVPPNNVASIGLRFRPEDLDLHGGELVILSNDPDEPEVRIPVSGTGSECPTAVITFVDGDEEIKPFDTVRLYGGDSIPADEPIELYEWTLEQRPVGATTVLSSLDTSATEVPVDLAGQYVVSLHVFDTEGIRSCEPALATINVIPTEDLVVQLVWDHADADLDLHMLREGGTPFTHEGDCYFSNRAPEDAPWSANPDENPVLDHDDDEGYGPENLNIKHPAPGSRWTLLVHYWNKQTDESPITDATVRVFAYGQQVVEITRTFEDDQQLWTALEIVWPVQAQAPPTLNQIGSIEPFQRPF
jgi:hypothetical protein